LTVKTLDRYITREFVGRFVGILCVLTVVFLLKEILRQLSDILSKEPPFYQVVLYFLYALPEELLFAVPTTVILAMMFSVGSLAKHKEVLAVHACGISYLRIGLPLAGVIVLITAAVYLGNETILPICQERADYIEEVVFEEKDQSVLSRLRNVTTKGAGNRFYTMKNFDSNLNRMELPTITDLRPDFRTIVRRIDGKVAQLVEEYKPGKWRPVTKPEKDRKYDWEFHDAEYFEFDEKGHLTVRRHYDTKLVAMEENLDRFLGTNKDIEEMNLLELHERCAIEAERGKGKYYSTLRTQLHNRMALPLATILLGLLGYTFAIRSSVRSLVLEFGMALLTIVAYYAMATFWVKMGREGWTSPVVAAWFTSVFFTFVLVWRLHAIERVPSG